MRECVVFLSVLFVFLLCLSGCSSDKEKLDGICSDLKTISQMTDDCHKMAQKLSPVNAEFNHLVDKLGAKPDATERAQYVNSVSVCLQTLLEIQTGTCGNDVEVLGVLGVKTEDPAAQADKP